MGRCAGLASPRNWYKSIRLLQNGTTIPYFSKGKIPVPEHTGKEDLVLDQPPSLHKGQSILESLADEIDF